MRTIAAGLTSHIAGECTSLANCWKVTLTNATVKAFTDHDTDLVVDAVTYLAASGYTASDVETTAALNVDNQALQNFAVAPGITEAELLSGVWDYATVDHFQVNWSSVTDGKIQYPGYRLGEISVMGQQAAEELRGLTQHYTATIVERTGATCRANLGDARCGVSLGGFTVTGTIDSVGDDNMTIIDAARAEAGPTGGIAVSAVTQADPGVVTLASALNLAEGSAITIAGVAGMVEINGTTLFRNPNAAKTTFELGVDTTAYGAYMSGGTVSPLGGTSGYFDGGVMTWTSGANNGLSGEVASYTVGQIVLALPMPYAIAAGDTYSLIAGCDKTFPTCRDRFSNVLNFRGEPYLGGMDKLVQIGRHT
jgi:hypothetical protein